MKKRISVIGSGNWGTAMSKLIAHNIKENTNFEDDIYMWTFEEMVDGRKLTEIINTEHENSKYLPGVKLPHNIIAVPDLQKCTKEGDVLVFIIPHQFIQKTVEQMKGNIKQNAVAINLSKGFILQNDDIILIHEYISKELKINCGVLMGANIATQIGFGCISEGTLAADKKDKQMFLEIFNSYIYRVNAIEDKACVELFGALKNIVALGYGMGKGMSYPENTTVAILRGGLKEILKFNKMFYPNTKMETLIESAGIADLIVSCTSGRNFKCGEKMAGKNTLNDIEKTMDGQKLQGTLTAKEINHFLVKRKLEKEFPFFTMVYKICYEDEMCDSILETISFESGKNV